MPPQIENSFHGIVLRTYPSGESDLVVVILSPEMGKITLLSKNARKGTAKKTARFEVFERGTFVSKKGKGKLPLVQQFTSHLPSDTPRERRLSRIRDSLHKICVASVLCESFDYLTLEQAPENGSLYELLTLSLEAIAESSEFRPMLKALYLSLGELLAKSGYATPLAQEAPSALRLRSLLLIIEECCEREIKSKTMLLEMIEELRE